MKPSAGCLLWSQRLTNGQGDTKATSAFWLSLLGMFVYCDIAPDWVNSEQGPRERVLFTQSIAYPQPSLVVLAFYFWAVSPKVVLIKVWWLAASGPLLCRDWLSWLSGEAACLSCPADQKGERARCLDDSCYEFWQSGKAWSTWLNGKEPREAYSMWATRSYTNTHTDTWP